MTFDLISGLHMQIQTWHPPLRLCLHAKYYVKSGLTNVLKNANKTKNMHLFSIRIANYKFALSFKEALQFWALVNKLTRCLLGNFASWFSLLLIFLSSSFTLKDFLNRFMCHTVCTQIRLDMSSVLIWVQSVL